MNILLHDYSAHPFQLELSRELAKRGHNVLHAYSGSFLTPHGRTEVEPTDPPTFQVHPIRLASMLNKDAYFQRWRQERRYGRLLRDLITAKNPDVVITANAPSDVQTSIARACRARGVKLVSWAQDINGVAAHRILRKRIPVLGALVGRYYMRVDRAFARQSHAIVLITEDFRSQMLAWGVPASRLTVIPNWAPLADLPVCPKDNAWSRQHGLHDRFCIMYCGTLAMKHNPALLLELARKFRHVPDARVVVISEGTAAEWLKRQAASEGLSNLVFFPFLRFADMPMAMASADILVAILEADAATASVPSKVLTYMCSGRPLLLAVPAENLAARTVLRARAGLVVSPDDLAAFGEAAERLARGDDERLQLGSNARSYAERTFDIVAIADRFENVLNGIVRRPAASRSARSDRHRSGASPGPLALASEAEAGCARP